MARPAGVVVSVQAEVAAGGVQVPQQHGQIGQRAAKPVDRPRHDHIELALGHGLQHLVEGGALIAALGPGDAGILVDLEDAPAGTLDHGPEF
jgi:hypothetical protein